KENDACAPSFIRCISTFHHTKAIGGPGKKRTGQNTCAMQIPPAFHIPPLYISAKTQAPSSNNQKHETAGAVHKASMALDHTTPTGAKTKEPPWLWTSTFQQVKMNKMTLLEVYLMARRTHLLLEPTNLLLEPTPWKMLMEQLLLTST
ncbi:unnamed protein product, partial [Urochloa humidicola]